MANVFGYSQTGAAPVNMVTTNTSQLIPATKTFSSESNVFYGDGSNLTGVAAGAPANMVTTNTPQNVAGVSDITGVKRFSSGSNVFFGTTFTGGTFAGTHTGNGAGLTSLPAPTNMVTTDTQQSTQNQNDITGMKRFSNTSNTYFGDGGNLTGLSTSQIPNVMATNTNQTTALNSAVTGQKDFTNGNNTFAGTFTGAISGTTVSASTSLTSAGPFFGRNDTTANIFSGTLPGTYPTHPIGWTIKATKVMTSFPSGSTITDVISAATATTAFTALSNGVWKFGCAFNNATVNGNMTGGNIIVSWGLATGGGLLNGIASTALPGNQATTLHFYTNAGLNVFGYCAPEAVYQFTGNGTTNIVLNLFCTYTSIPTLTFNIWATKVA